jgi:Resolvase, N terminal domain
MSFAEGRAMASKAKAKVLACYVRVSTIGQNEAGQRAEIERWLTGNSITPASVRWFVDKGRSGDNLTRPAFERLQAAVFAGEVGTVVTYKLDRISRSLRDGINVLSEWCDKGLRVVSVTQQIDFNGTVGKMLAAVLLGSRRWSKRPGGSGRQLASPSPRSAASIVGARSARQRPSLNAP